MMRFVLLSLYSTGGNPIYVVFLERQEKAYRYKSGEDGRRINAGPHGLLFCFEQAQFNLDQLLVRRLSHQQRPKVSVPLGNENYKSRRDKHGY